MSVQVLTLLKYGVLALLYLFFLRVLFAVWSELKPQTSPRVLRDVTPTPPNATPAPLPETVAAAPAPVPDAAPITDRRSPRPTTERSDRPIGELVLRQPEALAGLTYPVGAEVTIGRAAGCGIPIDDTFVSTLHARVFPREASILIEDLGSTNGTFVNGAPVTSPTVLHVGDSVRIGSTVLELR